VKTFIRWAFISSAPYNFLSTFSGAHFPQPGIVVAHIGLAF
jgi:hypothetical protein